MRVVLDTNVIFQGLTQQGGAAGLIILTGDRLSKLLALLALAFVWAMKMGLWQHSLKPIPLKSHQRRARSLFRSGFDYLRNLFTNLDHKFDAFLKVQVNSICFWFAAQRDRLSVTI